MLTHQWPETTRQLQYKQRAEHHWVRSLLFEGKAEREEKVFETGRQYASDFKNNMTIQFDALLPKWNYTVIPQSI